MIHKLVSNVHVTTKYNHFTLTFRLRFRAMPSILYLSFVVINFVCHLRFCVISFFCFLLLLLSMRPRSKTVQNGSCSRTKAKTAKGDVSSDDFSVFRGFSPSPLKMFLNFTEYSFDRRVLGKKNVCGCFQNIANIDEQ